MPGDWRFGFQSKGRGGGEWMEPEADDAVRVLAEEGWKKILVVPVGFVSDNVETLYDLDIVLRAPDREPRHRVPALARAQRLAVLHRGAGRRGHRLPRAPAGGASPARSRTSRTRTDERASSASSSSAAAWPGWARRACSKRRAPQDPSVDWQPLRAGPAPRRQGPHRPPRRVRRRGRPGLGHHREALADHRRPRGRHRRPLPRLQRGHPQELRLHAREPARAARGHHPHGPHAHGAVRDEPPDDAGRARCAWAWTSSCRAAARRPRGRAGPSARPWTRASATSSAGASARRRCSASPSPSSPASTPATPSR